MNEEIKSKNFDINAKYEDMILNAKSIVEHHLFVSDGSCEAPVYINLAYDVKNHLPTLIKEFQQLKSVNSYSKRMLYKINKDRLEANQRLLKENQKLKDNWNKLKEWLEKTQINKVDIDEWTIIQVRDKMQEIEKGGMNE